MTRVLGSAAASRTNRPPRSRTEVAQANSFRGPRTASPQTFGLAPKLKVVAAILATPVRDHETKYEDVTGPVLARLARLARDHSLLDDEERQ